MAIPDIESDSQYRLVVNKVTNIANALLKPEQEYTVKGKVVIALQALDADCIISVEKV